VRLERDPAAAGGVTWRVPADLEAGPWLVVGWDGDWCRVQPTVWDAGGANPAAVVEAQGGEAIVDVANLADAVRLRDAAERRLVLDHLLEQLAADPTHPDWDGVLQYAQTFQGLPATTLDLMHRLTHHPSVIAALMFRADQSVFRALCSLLEELPFSWHMMALDAWLEAATKLAGALRRQLQGIDGNVDELVCSAFETFFALAPQAYPHFALVAEMVRARVCGRGQSFPALDEARRALAAARTPPGRDVLLALLGNVQQDLMRAHADDTWPKGCEVPAWEQRRRALPPALASLWLDAPPGTEYRTAVLNAPVVAALSGVCGICPTPELTYEVRALRAFDPRWFDEAHRLLVALAIGA
jgi:hypothetical protein